jgi:hypothetical protein
LTGNPGVSISSEHLPNKGRPDYCPCLLTAGAGFGHDKNKNSTLWTDPDKSYIKWFLKKNLNLSQVFNGK